MCWLRKLVSSISLFLVCPSVSLCIHVFLLCQANGDFLLTSLKVISESVLKFVGQYFCLLKKITKLIFPSSDLVCCLVSYFCLFLMYGVLCLCDTECIWRSEVRGQLAKKSVGFFHGEGSIQVVHQASCRLFAPWALPWLYSRSSTLLNWTAFPDLFKSPASDSWLRMRWFSFRKGLRWVQRWGRAHQMSRRCLYIGTV